MNTIIALAPPRSLEQGGKFTGSDERSSTPASCASLLVVGIAYAVFGLAGFLAATHLVVS
jgi:hypothetical protein